MTVIFNGDGSVELENISLKSFVFPSLPHITTPLNKIDKLLTIIKRGHILYFNFEIKVEITLKIFISSILVYKIMFYIFKKMKKP